MIKNAPNVGKRASQPGKVEAEVMVMEPIAIKPVPTKDKFL